MNNNENIAQAWLEKAKHDIGIAKLAIDEGYVFADAICYHCQQYAEKVIKSKLIRLGIEAPKTHNLAYLLQLVAEHENVVDEIYSLAEKIEDYSVGVRYPSSNYEPSAEDAKEAYETAIKIGEYFVK